MSVGGSAKPRRRAKADDSLGRDLALRIFALADYAVVTPDQKLYVSGANIQNQWGARFPLTVSQLSVVVLLGVPWHLASEPHRIRVRMLDAERRAIGPDPLLDATAETGRPPGTRAGDELAIPIALSLAGLRIEREALVFFHLEVDDSRIAVQPFHFRQMPVVPSATPKKDDES